MKLNPEIEKEAGHGDGGENQAEDKTVIAEAAQAEEVAQLFPGSTEQPQNEQYIRKPEKEVQKHVEPHVLRPEQERDDALQPLAKKSKNRADENRIQE